MIGFTSLIPHATIPLFTVATAPRSSLNKNPNLKSWHEQLSQYCSAPNSNPHLVSYLKPYMYIGYNSLLSEFTSNGLFNTV